MLEKWQLDLRSWDTPVFLHFYQCWYRHSKRLLICVTTVFSSLLVINAGLKVFFFIWYDIKRLKVRWPWGLSWRRCSPTQCRLHREDGWRVRGPVWASDSSSAHQTVASSCSFYRDDMDFGTPFLSPLIFWLLCGWCAALCWFLLCW